MNNKHTKVQRVYHKIITKWWERKRSGGKEKSLNSGLTEIQAFKIAVGTEGFEPPTSCL
jgi:hypothetical protein